MSELGPKDFVIPVSPDLDLQDETVMPIDEAVDAIFTRLGWPLLGGPSGRGWSFFSTAQKCARLFQATYDRGKPNELLRQISPSQVPVPLQVGALYHTLQALYYAGSWGESGCLVAPDRQGLCGIAFATRGRRKTWAVPGDAAETLIAELKQMCGASDLVQQLRASIGEGELPKPEGRAPRLDVVLEAERLYDAHSAHWGKREEVEPLAIEWFAEDAKLGYSCRYDMIGKVGEGDPIIPPGIFIFERKTAKWADEKYLEAWSLDGEILGQLHVWHRSDCAQRFGELTGIVIDVVTKAKSPACVRLVLPPNLPATASHARWIEYDKAQIALWRAMDIYPMSVANCHTRYGRCSQFEICAESARIGE